jgi:hypothetical protein
MPAIRIACVGHAALDHVFEVAAFPTRPTKTPASSYRPGTGGMAFNAAIAAARLGAAVRMIGRVGSEPGAQMLRERLRAEGVDARGLESVPGATTSVSAIVVDARGERQIFNHRGDAIARAHALDTRILHGADVVLADPRWVAGAAAALRWARPRARVTAMLDVDVAPTRDSSWLGWRNGRCCSPPRASLPTRRAWPARRAAAGAGQRLWCAMVTAAASAGAVAASRRPFTAAGSAAGCRRSTPPAPATSSTRRWRWRSAKGAPSAPRWRSRAATAAALKCLGEPEVLGAPGAPSGGARCRAVASLPLRSMPTLHERLPACHRVSATPASSVESVRKDRVAVANLSPARPGARGARCGATIHV